MILISKAGGKMMKWCFLNYISLSKTDCFFYITIWSQHAHNWQIPDLNTKLFYKLMILIWNMTIIMTKLMLIFFLIFHNLTLDTMTWNFLFTRAIFNYINLYTILKHMYMILFNEIVFKNDKKDEWWNFVAI